MKKNLIFRGAATALITPMKNGHIDYPALSKIIEFQLAGGIEALVVGGTTGEAATLSDRERYEMYTFVKDKVAGRAKIILGTGTNDTRMVINHTRTAAAIGCDATLVVTPYYNKGTHSGVVKHYMRIAALSDTPIILYNVPGRTGVNLTIPQLEELAKEESIVAIKEASDSVDRLTELLKFGDDLYLYAGNDSQIFATLIAGGMGVISVLSNIYPANVTEICRDCFSGNTDSALKAQLLFLDFIKLLFKETNPAPIKYAMSVMGLCRSEIRLPLDKPEKKTQAAIRSELTKLNGNILSQSRLHPHLDNFV